MPEDTQLETASMNVKEQLKESFGNRQFAYYLLLFVPAWTFTATALEVFQVPVAWTFALGTVFGGIVTKGVEWFQDWRDLSKGTSVDGWTGVWDDDE